MEDIRDILFENIASKRFRAVLTAERSGVLSGVDEAYASAKKLGIDLELCKGEGAEISHGERFGNFLGTSKQIAMAEECLIGTLAKASGIATAARTAVQLADTGIVPGSGVANSRAALNEASLGVPVVALGIPTVVEARTLCADLLRHTGGAEQAPPELLPGPGLMVTPRDIDPAVTRIAALAAEALNRALHDLRPGELQALTES